MTTRILLKGGHDDDPVRGVNGPADVLIQGDRIARVDKDLPAEDAAVIDVPRGWLIVPGLIDMHVHLREPGQEHKETMQVLSREGLTIGLEISVIYRLNPDSAARVYQTILNGDYEGIILIPQFRAISRAVTASFQASALYSTEREKLSEMIQHELTKVVSSRGVIIESAPLRNVGLPPQLTEAINVWLSKELRKIQTAISSVQQVIQAGMTGGTPISVTDSFDEDRGIKFEAWSGRRAGSPGRAR